MKKLFLLLPLFGALPALQATAAPPADVQVERTFTTSKMWPDKFFEYLRAYELSNGQTLVLYERGGTVFASLDHGHPHKLQVDEANNFVATDGALKMHLVLGDRGEVKGKVQLTVPEQYSSDGTAIPRHSIDIAML